MELNKEPLPITKEQIVHWLETEEIEFHIDNFRKKYNIDPKSSTLYVTFGRLCKEKKLKQIGRGFYRRIKKVNPVKVFIPSRERKPPFELFFPIDSYTGMNFFFADDIVIREGDLISIGGVSNYGKTTIALNFLAENIHHGPILMGNEYTTRIGDTDEFEPTPRFLNRLDAMDWVEWTNGNSDDRFTLLPVREDYAQHIVKDKINIVDWVNLDADKLYNISKVEEDIKAEVGRGIGIVVLQKGDGTSAARGGQFTKDFIDCELLIDKFTETESMLTIGKVKEYTHPVIGRKFAFGISQGVKIVSFREIVRCPQCWGKGWKKSGNSSLPCDECYKTGYIDK